MSWFASLVLGLVQGLTEFLPISSSAHLRLVAALAGWPDPGAAFTAVTQLGTETAVLVYFRRDITAIVGAWCRSLAGRHAGREQDARLGWMVLLGSVPIGVLGLLFQDAIEGPFRDLRLVAVSLIVLGLVLGAADRLHARRAGPGRTLDSLTLRDGLCLGLAQALALVPGVSRSGATISAGLLLGYTRRAAARYSFLLAVPAVLASGFFELRRIDSAHTAWGPTALATVLAFLVAYAVIAWLMGYLETRSFLPFVGYRVLVGALLLALVGAGVWTPGAGA